MKRCTGCGNDFPASVYAVKLRYPDGSPRYSYPRCPICVAEDRSEAKSRAWHLHQGADIIDLEQPPRLPIEPWRQWLLGQLEDVDDGDRTRLSARLGVQPRRLYEWLNFGITVRLDSVDRCLCLAHEVGTLSDLSAQTAALLPLVEQFGPFTDAHGRDLLAEARHTIEAWSELYATLPELVEEPESYELLEAA